MESDKNSDNVNGKPRQSFELTTVTNGPDHSAQEHKYRNARGLGWFITGLFIVGEMAGGGLVAMPTAMVDASWIGGICVIILGAILSGYTGIQLGNNWTMLQERWPEYRSHCRKPYPAMGFRAIGPKFKILVSVCLDITQFGIAVVFLLLASNNIHNLLKSFFDVDLNFCILILIVALILLPITFLKSPKDFWPAVVGAMVTTSLAVVLICVGALIDAPTCAPIAYHPPIKFERFFLAFGTIMFAYGGHGAFPTIQHDMKKPYQFNRSIWLSYSIIVAMYFPVSVIGYISYGGALEQTVITSIQTKWIQQSANILITLHVILTLTIVFNVLNQEMEELFNVPLKFGWKRIVTRSGIMLAIVFVAETVPRFGVLLDLVGGSTITLMTMIFPGVFNLFLIAAKKKAAGKINTDDRASLKEVISNTPKHILFLNLAVIVFAIIGGLAASYSAIREIVATNFVAPCYVQPFLSTTMSNSSGDISHTACCGQYANVSRLPSIVCGGTS